MPTSSPTADLVERLRSQYAVQYKDEQAPAVIYHYERERFEAADELDRLTEENARLREALTSAVGRMETAGPDYDYDDVIARARAALPKETET